MAGTCLVIDDAVDEILVGSDPDCRLSLDLPGVSPIHARVWRDLGGITVYDTRSQRGVFVNDVRVVDHAAIHDGDVLWLGVPGDPDSVMIQCRLPEESVLGAPVADTGFIVPEDGPPPMDAPVFEEPPPVVDEPEVSPVVEAEPEIIAEAWAEQAPMPIAPSTPVAHSVPMFADEPPAPAPVAAPTPAPVAAPTPMATTTAPAVGDAPAPLVDESWLVDDMPAPVEELPAPAAPSAPAPDHAIAPLVDSAADFVMDPTWGEYDTLGAPAESPSPEEPPPPVDLDSLLADVPAPPQEAPAPPPPAPVVDTPAAPRAFEEAIALDAPAPAPQPPVARQMGGAPPLTPAPPRAIIDDRRPRPAPQKSSPSPRPGSTEGGVGSGQTSGRPATRVLRSQPSRSARGPLLPIVAAVVVLAALGGGYFAWNASRTPHVTAVSPARVTTGNVLTLTGSNLGETVATTSASIGGRPARVVQAAGDRLQIEVPELPTTPGTDTSVPVVVTAGGRESKPASVAVFQAPHLRSLVPDVAMPGDEVVLSGTSLGAGVKVRFGDVEAQVVSATPAFLTVKVPAMSAFGTEVPVVASMGADPSNALLFVVGKVPIVTGIEPRSASPGDLITVAGRGFNARPQANRVTVGGAPALVISAGPRSLEFVVPRSIAGGEEVAITVPGSTQVGETTLSVMPLAEPFGFQFVAEPFEDVPGHEHAAVATGLGPAFILTAAQGKSAAERAYEAQKRFNDAAQVLRSTRTAEIRARYEPAPVLFLASRDTVLVEVTGADADAYNEDWTRSRAKGAPVTVARLTAWWEAVARDLVLLLLRGEKPQYAVALAPEGKVLADLHDAARRSVAVGVPSALLAEAKPPMREALRAVALRVPAAVGPPVGVPGVPVPAVPEGPPPLKLDGSWRGSETENGVRKPINILFHGGTGSLTYERALSMTVAVLAVQQQKDVVRFEVRTGAGIRYYRGKWDGAQIAGKLTSDADGRTEMGTFELDPSR